MKAKLILINWLLSFFVFGIDTDHTPTWKILLGVGWFLLSCVLLIIADRRGWIDKEIQKNKLLKFLMEE